MAKHIEVKTSAFSYNDRQAPKEYVCHECSQGGRKLWREWNTFLDYQVLRCFKCMTKHREPNEWFYQPWQFEHPHAGTLVPAVPTEDGDTYWGYTSIPMMGVIWWKRLPMPTRTKEDIEKELTGLRADKQLWEEVKYKYDPTYIQRMMASTDLGIQATIEDLELCNAEPKP